MNKKVICVFGNSSPKHGSAEYEEAMEAGSLLAQAGFAVCTGGYYGVMEAVSRGAQRAGGRTIGITTPFYRLSANSYIDEEISIPRWQDRLFALVEKGHGYLVLRGGTGTLLELAALWESLNKGAISPRPCVAIDFWAPLVLGIREVERAHPHRRWAESDSGLIQFVVRPRQAVEIFARELNGGA